MDIKYKLIEHERTEDAPFVGALISAPSCKIKCKGCYNRHLKLLPDLKATAEEIIAEVRENIFNEGIILGGLEWSEHPQEMLELCHEASKQELQIMIYTGHTLNEFRAIVGKSCSAKVGFDTLLTSKMLMETDMELYAMVGSMILDYYIPTDYYIKAGRYDRENLSVDREHFGVHLASENQNVYKFEMEKVVD